MLGATIKELREEGILPPQGDGGRLPDHAPMAVKEAILPFKRFRTREGKVVDSLLGPEMRSTGEVMGIDLDFGSAFAKSQMSSGGLPDSGSVFVSIANRDKRAMIFPVKRLADLGFTIIATSGTAEVLRRNGIQSKVVRKIREREPRSRASRRSSTSSTTARWRWWSTRRPEVRAADGYEIRAATTGADKPIITTVQELAAAVQGIEARRSGEIRVKSLQDHARDLDLFRRHAVAGEEVS